MTSASKSLGSRTAHGVALLTAQTMVGKVLGALSQIVLAWLLAPEAFGLVALAYTIISFSSIIEQIGLREILIREQDRYDRWVNSAFWLALTLGCGTGLVSLIAGPVGASLYNEPSVTGLVWVMAFVAPFSCAAQVFDARLERDMRFGRITMIQFATQLLMVLLSVGFAAAGAGAYAFVLPRLIVTPLRFVYMMRLTRPKLRATPQFHRWRVLLARGLPLTLSALFGVVNMNADYFILGLLVTKAVVGQYFFAYTQSTQFVQIFANNLTRVLMPGLSTMRDHPTRQVGAFIRAANLLASAGAPLCLMQAAVSGPLVRLLFDDKWLPAIPLLQLLSAAAFFGMVSWPTVSLLMAQGRYRTRMVLSAVSAAVFTGLVLAGALAGRPTGNEAIGAALGVVMYRLLMNPLQTYVACRPARVSIWRISKVFLFPAIGAAAAIGSAWWLALQVSQSLTTNIIYRDIIQMSIVGVIGPSLYAVWLRTTRRAIWNEALSLASGLIPSRLKRAHTKLEP